MGWAFPYDTPVDVVHCAVENTCCEMVTSGHSINAVTLGIQRRSQRDGSRTGVPHLQENGLP